MLEQSLTDRQRPGIASVISSALVLAGCSSPAGPTPPSVVTDPPKITCPAPQTIQLTTGTSTAVVYATPTVNARMPVTTICTPPSGSVFAVGQNTVSCTATDWLQRTDVCTFLVTVLPPPTLAATSFVAFGDSLTRGEDGRNSLSDTAWPSRFYPRVLLPDTQTYPGVLNLDLAGRYRTQSPTVDNQGSPGEAVTDSGTFSRFVGLISSRRYSVVLIMEGSNDVFLGTRDAVVLQLAIMGLRKMVSDAKRRLMLPYLATIPPMNPAGSRGGIWGADLVPDFNERIREVARAEGVTLVDVYQGFGGNLALLASDGLHPNADGYAKIADLFFAAIRQTIETPMPHESAR